MAVTGPDTRIGDVAELVRRIRSGERQAEEELIRRFSRGLFLMLRRSAGNLSLAEDLHQETFRVVLGKVREGEVREPEKFLGFLRSTARHLLIAERRKAARRGETEASEPAAGEAPQLRRLLRSEEAGRVRRLLGELRFPRDRELLVRFYLAEESKEKICAELDVEPARFKKVLYRARIRMRELWEHTRRDTVPPPRLRPGALQEGPLPGPDPDARVVGTYREETAALRAGCAMMDHAEIERNDVVERYVTGRLDPQELARFEEHYLDCATCCDAIEDAERLELGLAQMAAEETARAVRQSLVATLLARARGPLVAGLVLAVALVPAGLAWRDNQRLVNERAELAAELAEERRPRVNTPILTFEARRGAGAVRQVSLRGEPEWIVLAVELKKLVAQRYRATLTGAAGSLIWQSSELEPSYEGTLTLSLHSSLLPPGDYQLDVRDLPSGELRSFPLRVVRLP